MLKDRHLLARKLLKESELDAFVFLDLSNVRFFCGFSGTDGALIATPDADAFLTDSRYTTQASEQVEVDEVIEYRSKEEGVVSFLLRNNVHRVGFEAETVNVALLKRLEERCAGRLEWVPVDRQVQSLRAQKHSDEVAHILEATRLNQEAFEEVLPQIRPGVCERELALALEFAMKSRGGEEKAFDFIVASGPRGALPHGVASDKILQAGELVTIDFGIRVNGYHSDETITVALGDVSSRLREVYDTVLEAHDRAMAQIRPGVELKALDAIARDYIAEKGFGAYFGHGLGHGVGLEIHEFPTVSSRSLTVAEEGMVFTIEPGIYIPEVGGVRIEDMVQVTADGYRCLTRIPKDFRTLPV